MIQNIIEQSVNQKHRTHHRGADENTLVRLKDTLSTQLDKKRYIKARGYPI